MNRISELEQHLASASAPSARVDALNTLAEELDDLQLDRSLDLFRQAADLAAAAGYREGLAWALSGQAKIAGDFSHFEEMSRLCFQTLEVVSGYPPNQAGAYAQTQMSWMYFYLGEYSSALEWGLRGLEAARASGSRHREANALDVVATIYSIMEDHEQALACHAQALQVVEEIADLNEKAVIFNNSAMTLLGAGRFPDALDKGMRGLELARQLGMAPFISNYYDTVAQVMLAMGDVQRAETMLRTGLSLSIAKRPDYLLAAYTKNLGKVCLLLGKYDEAAELLHTAIADFEQLGARGELSVCYRALSQLYEQQGNFVLALEQYKAYDAKRESTFGKETSRRITALKASYDLQLAQRDAEIERLRNVDLQNEIEERKRIQLVLEQMATIDALTNLNNRGHFFSLAEREVERALRYAHSLAVLMIDVDQFKEINDHYGHIAGDQILVALASIILKELRDVDLAGRYGGDEFAILLPETTAENACLVGERIRSAIAHPAILTDAGRVAVTVSVGISGLALNNQHAARELNAMLDRADRGLYKAKHAGRNRSLAISP
jgi:diguanylate cyclase (GGDEF)-like protein